MNASKVVRAILRFHSCSIAHVSTERTRHTATDDSGWPVDEEWDLRTEEEQIGREEQVKEGWLGAS